MAIIAASAARTTVKAAGRPLVTIDEQVRIPPYVRDLDSFHLWADSKDFPKTGRICYLNGTIWVEMSMEQLFTHNRVKTRMTRTLDSLTEYASAGYYFSDGVRISHTDADLSTEPDGLFVSFLAIESKRVCLVPGRDYGFTRVEGSPDMALEIVSDTSVEKDTDLLRDLYWKAGITEFWLVDVRGDGVKFEILRRAAKGYSKVRTQPNGWLRSHVFGRSFQLTRKVDRLGNYDFILAVRD